MANPPSSRRILTIKVKVWRFLMSIGMYLNQFAPPRPPPPSFTIDIPSRISSRRGKFRLVVYAPSSYHAAPATHRFPLVVNFHGGGFTLGKATDDARWAQAVVERCQAVMVSVEYRLAPEYPFSIGVDDGTDALLYLAAHADELKLDPHRIALSGFSAGGNYALTVPIMLHDLLHHTGRRNFPYSASAVQPDPLSRSSSKSSSADYAIPEASASTHSLEPLTPSPDTLELPSQLPDLTLVALCAFYPPVDFRIPRSEKRNSHPRPDLNIPPVLSRLFDESYLSPAHVAPENQPLDRGDPYLSPAAAADAVLRAAYPADVLLYTAEFDMLNEEGVAFGARLARAEIGKNVGGGLVRGVPHGFDRRPNPIRFARKAVRCYEEACVELSAAFERG